MKPLMIFDGDCSFCRHWIHRFQAITKDRVNYAPYQDAAQNFPQIPRDRFAQAVQFVETDGKIYEAAEAVLRCLSYSPGKKWPYWLYRKVPFFSVACESAYRVVARKRKPYPKNYLEFIRLFNEGKYFESHETLEELWKLTDGEEKIFYQGLIQAAVALHHFQKNNRKGAEYELKKSKEKLLIYPEIFFGLNIKHFMNDLESYLTHKTTHFPSITW